MCQEFCPRGGGGMHGRGACMVGGGGHVWWGGMHDRGCAWQGVCMARGVCMAGGMCGRGHAWQGGDVWQILRDTVNEQAVRIPLECILVDPVKTFIVN